MIKKSLIADRLAILLVAALLSTGVPAADPQAVRYYEDAVSRFNTGDHKGAIIQLKNALQRDPGQLPAKILLGRVHLAMGNPRAAEEELVQARQLGADPVLIALPLARARNQLGEYDRNIDQLVPTRFPRLQQPEIWVELGLSRLYSDDTAGARIAFLEALEIDPALSGAKVGLARIPLEEKAYVEAEQLADEALASDPQDPEAWIVKALASHGAGRLDVAVEAYGRAYDLDPRRLQAAIGEAGALMDANKPAKATALLRSLESEHPYSPTIPYLLSNALMAIDRPDDAAEALSRAAGIVKQISPTDLVDRPADLLLFGTIAFDNGELEQAFSFLSTYVEGGGKDIRGRKMLGRVLISMDRPGDALRVLVRLSSGGKADAESLTLLGDANVQLGDFDAARRYYQEALTRQDAGPAIERRLAMAQYRGGLREEGLDTMGRLADQLPPGADTDTSLLLGFLYLAEDRVDEAEQIARSLLERDPQNRDYRNFLATTLAKQGKTTQARQAFEQLRNDHPAFDVANLNLIKLDIAEGRYADATRAIELILSADPDNIEAMYDAARIARLRNDNATAFQLLEKVTAAAPDRIDAAELLVEVLLAEGNGQQALEVAQNLFAELPKSIRAHLLLAATQAASRALDDARVTLKKASLLAGNDLRQLMRVGEWQMRVGAFADAGWTFTKAVSLRPEDANARLSLATSLFRQQEYAEAEAEVSRLRARYPELVVADVLLADIRKAQGAWDEAIRLYRDAQLRQPSPEITDSLYRALKHQGRNDDAVLVLRQWLESRPDSVEVLNLLAEHYLNGGQAEKALPIYRRLTTLAPGNPRFHNNLAVALSGIDNERALQAALEAYRLSPENPYVLDTLGWSMVQIGEHDKGIGYLRDARARNATSPTVRYHLGVALQESGRAREALAEFRSALRLAGDFPERSDTLLRIEILNASL